MKQAVCSAVPEGRTVGLSGSVGLIGGETGTLEIVTNFNTGEVSAFASGGIQVGFNGGLAGNGTIGLIRNLGDSNTNYPGPFSNVAASVGPIGGFVAASSAGYKGPLIVDSSGAQVAGVSAGISAVGAATVTGSVTTYTKLLSLGILLRAMGRPSMVHSII